MTYLADLDVSVIDELLPGPPGHQTIADTRRDEVLGRIRHEVIGGRKSLGDAHDEESETLQLERRRRPSRRGWRFRN